jgi:hypothetical protein
VHEGEESGSFRVEDSPSPNSTWIEFFYIDVICSFEVKVGNGLIRKNIH